MFGQEQFTFCLVDFLTIDNFCFPSIALNPYLQKFQILLAEESAACENILRNIHQKNLQKFIST